MTFTEEEQVIHNKDATEWDSDQQPIWKIDWNNFYYMQRQSFGNSRNV